MSGYAATNRPIRGSSQRAAKDGTTLTRSWRGLARAVISLTAAASSANAVRTRRRESFALVGQPYSAAGAFDEAHAEVALQRFDLVADRAMGEAQRLRRLGEALHARGSLEGAQRLHRWKAKGSSRSPDM